MTQTEHLQLIRARCVELLEIAEKRTAGVWRTFQVSGTICVGDTKEIECVSDLDKSLYIEIFSGDSSESDATFIASCAGAAEAGWRATVAAIDAFFKLDGVTYGWDGDCGATCIADTLADSITAVWPIELLNNK